VTARADFQKGVAAYDAGDYATALRELTPLAEQGNADAQTYLGVMYQNGGGVPQDDKTAVKWYDLVAKRPPPGTEVVPGAIGSLSPTIPRRPTTPCIPPTPCVPQDDKTAVKWYRLAAKQGHAGAQNNLGFLYMIGQGVPQNYQTAIKWFRISAEQGFSLAQNNLGLLYVKGQGVVQDYVYAHMWWNIAASSGNKSAGTNRDKVAGMMTPSQIAEAQDLARECVRKKYKDC
jgi:hypothetical protein